MARKMFLQNIQIIAWVRVNAWAKLLDITKHGYELLITANLHRVRMANLFIW